MRCTKGFTPGRTCQRQLSDVGLAIFSSRVAAARITTSVTAYAVPPSPQGEGFYAKKAKWQGGRFPPCHETLGICFLTICSLRSLGIFAEANSLYRFAIRHDINPNRPAGHIVCISTYRARKRISQIPSGIYIAAPKALTAPGRSRSTGCGS